MANRHFSHFTNVEELKGMSQDNLLLVLAPHSDFLISQGFDVAAQDPNAFDYEKLASIFMQPNGDIAGASELYNDLSLINSMSDQNGMDDLIFAARQAGLYLAFNDEASAADVAMLYRDRNDTP